jgi:hypothetical protein
LHPLVNAGIANGVKHEEGLANAIPSITQSKCPATSMVTHIANWDGSHFMTYKQRIRAYLFFSEVFDLLVADPNNYDNMLLKDKSRVCTNGNGEHKFVVQKSALFVEATCDDEGKYFPPLLFHELS